METSRSVKLAQILATAGVERAFVVASAHNLHILSHLVDVGIECIPARGELGAAHMADGHARAAGRATLLVTSTGPGAGNAVGAYSTAAKDGSPVIHLTTSHLPAGARAQGVHTVPDEGGWLHAMGAPVLDLAVQAPEEVRDSLAQGPQAMTVILPVDEEATAPLETSETWSRNGDARSKAHPNAIDCLRRWLDCDRRLLWIGGGARGLPTETLVSLAERSGASVATSCQGKDLFPADHPQFVGCTLQSTITQRIVENAEVCLALGSRMSEFSTAGGSSSFPEVLIRVAYSGESSLFSSVEVIHSPFDVTSLVNAAEREGVLAVDATDYGVKCGRQFREARQRKVTKGPEYVLIEGVRDSLQAGDTLVCDMTKLAFWMVLALNLPSGVRFLFPGLLNMGFGLPAGIGASIALPHSHTVVIVGDGGLLSVLSELDAASQLSGRISVVLIDDNGYGLLRPLSNHDVIEKTCTFDGPSWERIAQAFRLDYLKVDDCSEVRSALSWEGSGIRLIHVDGTGLASRNWREA